MVSEVSEDGRLGPDRLVVVGFSQGACVATEYALRHPGKVAAIVVFTGCLMGPPEENREWGRGRVAGPSEGPDHGERLG